jgi:hypothetical protein
MVLDLALSLIEPCLAGDVIAAYIEPSSGLGGLEDTVLFCTSID